LKSTKLPLFYVWDRTLELKGYSWLLYLQTNSFKAANIPQVSLRALELPKRNIHEA